MPPPRQALITGATGFVGSHLAARLKRDGWDAHAIVRPDSKAAPLKQLLGDDHVHRHDGTTENLLDIVKGSQPQVIFHLASHFLAQHGTKDISQLMRSNIDFSTQLAEAAAVNKVPYFINTGTAWQHFDDADYNPVNLYAATKQAFADILRYYAEAGALRAVTLELFDTYGPGDNRPKLFSALRQAASSGKPLAMSPGDQLIDLVYIDDVVEAYLAAAMRLYSAAGERFETFAISSGNPRPLREIVGLWSKIAQRSPNVNWGALPHRPREVMKPWSHGRPLPAWQPRISLEEGLRKMEGITEGAAHDRR